LAAPWWGVLSDERGFTMKWRAVVLTTGLVLGPAPAPAQAGQPDEGEAVVVDSTRHGGRTLALTFDDGPNPVDTPRLLEVLRRHHVKAVFCLWGDFVDAHPKLVRAIVAGGHKLCNHTMHHDNMGTWTPEQIKADLEEANAAIHRAVPGVPIKYFRAPYGSWGQTPQVLPLIVPKFLATDAFFIFLMVQFIRSLPTELDEAARIDGCGHWRIFWRIIMPLCTPAPATTAVFTFIWTWNDFFSQLIFLTDQDLHTVPVALRTFVDGQGRSSWGPLFAMSVVSRVRSGPPTRCRSSSGSTPTCCSTGSAHRKRHGGSWTRSARRSAADDTDRPPGAGRPARRGGDRGGSPVTAVGGQRRAVLHRRRHRLADVPAAPPAAGRRHAARHAGAVGPGTAHRRRSRTRTCPTASASTPRHAVRCRTST
jgi:peptidoglycan/xylan/chitin deacetylase (PgdA/CDA1 family)